MIKARLGADLDQTVRRVFPFIASVRIHPDVLTWVGAGVSALAAWAFIEDARLGAGLLRRKAERRQLPLDGRHDVPGRFAGRKGGVDDLLLDLNRVSYWVFSASDSWAGGRGGPPRTKPPQNRPSYLGHKVTKLDGGAVAISTTSI